MRHLLVALSFLAAACGDKPPGGDGDDCADSTGTLEGTATLGGQPAADATVYLATPGGDTRDTTADAEGRWSFTDLPPGDYIVAAVEAGGPPDSGGPGETSCASPDTPATVVACEATTVPLDLTDCITADKPNLYLYPAQDTPAAVRLHLRPTQRIVAADPAYPAGGWRGIAHPDGTFTTQGARAPFLFYEVSLAGAQAARFQRDAGWCLPEDGAVDAMAAILEAYGFTAREVDDFVDGWRHDLPPSPTGYAVYPQTNVDFAAGLTLSPPLPVHRLWLLVDDGAACAARAAPAVRPFPRQGAHAVEWGLVRDGLVP